MKLIMRKANGVLGMAQKLSDGRYVIIKDGYQVEWV